MVDSCGCSAAAVVEAEHGEVEEQKKQKKHEEEQEREDPEEEVAGEAGGAGGVRRSRKWEEQEELARCISGTRTSEKVQARTLPNFSAVLSSSSRRRANQHIAIGMAAEGWGCDTRAPRHTCLDRAVRGLCQLAMQREDHMLAGECEDDDRHRPERSL